MMKRHPILTILVATALTSCAAPPDEERDTITVVGADTNGFPIQQVVWLHRKPDLKEQECPIWAGSLVVLLAEQNDAVKIKADKTALPDEDRWHQVILKGNIVVGWIDKKLIVQVPIEVWKEHKRRAQPESGHVRK